MSATLPGTLPGLLDVVAVVSRKDSPWQWVCVSAPYAVDTESPGIMVVRLHGGHCSAVDADIADLSLDLTVPANRDRAARWLAERVGLKVGATAPEWRRLSPGRWHLCAERRQGRVRSVTFCAAVAGNPKGAGAGEIAVPGISTLTNPAEALALAVLAVSR